MYFFDITVRILLIFILRNLLVLFLIILIWYNRVISRRYLFYYINKKTFFLTPIHIYNKKFIKIILNNSNMNMNQLKFVCHIIQEKNLFYPINEEAQHLTWIRTFWLECMDCFLCPWEKSPLASLTLIWGNVLSSNNIIWYNYPFFFFSNKI